MGVRDEILSQGLILVTLVSLIAFALFTGSFSIATGSANAAALAGALKLDMRDRFVPDAGIVSSRMSKPQIGAPASSSGRRKGATKYLKQE